MIARPTFKLDHEERANRFLDAMDAVQSMLGQTVPGAVIETEKMAQLLGLLGDEAAMVIVPFRPGAANDVDD